MVMLGLLICHACMLVLSCMKLVCSCMKFLFVHACMVVLLPCGMHAKQGPLDHSCMIALFSQTRIACCSADRLAHVIQRKSGCGNVAPPDA